MQKNLSSLQYVIYACPFCLLEKMIIENSYLFLVTCTFIKYIPKLTVFCSMGSGYDKKKKRIIVRRLKIFKIKKKDYVATKKKKKKKLRDYIY